MTYQSFYRRLADLDDARATTALAKRYLVGDGAPRDYSKAAQMLKAADKKGSGEASSMIATLLASAAGNIEAWINALNYLQRAAELGFGSARGQLAALSADRIAASEAERENPASDIWKHLRHSIDLNAWLSPLPGREMSKSPDIRSYPGFVAPNICDWLVERARGRIERAQVFDSGSGMSRPDPARTNSAFEFKIVDADLVLLLTRARLAAAAGFSPDTLEDTNILHYLPGQEFRRHFDFLDPAARGMAQEIATHGQRIATFLIYLNDGFAGGETDFPLLNIRAKESKGGGLFFRSAGADGVPDRRTVHAGLPVADGEKWLFSQWVRARP